MEFVLSSFSKQSIIGHSQNFAVFMNEVVVVDDVTQLVFKSTITVHVHL